ncbi:MAG: hypothetical protein AAF830_17225 [Pseudomonadota bacterium]
MHARPIATTVLALTASLSAAQASDSIFEVMKTIEGTWEGALTYRDFSSNERVSIPHERTIHVGPNGQYALHENAYTDPGYQVFGAQMMQITKNAIIIGGTTGNSIEVERFSIEDASQGDDGWRAEAIGEGTDNGKPATIRLNLLIAENALIIEREVKAETDDDFLFRNEIRLERKGAAQ